MSKPGWNYIVNSPKWHYFDETGTSLCRRWAKFGSNDDADTEDNLNSSSNCKKCADLRRKQMKEDHR